MLLIDKLKRLTVDDNESAAKVIEAPDDSLLRIGQSVEIKLPFKAD